MIGFVRRLPVARGALLLTWMLMLPIGGFGVAQIVSTTVRQLSGPAEMVDFVAFYTAGRLLVDDPRHLYDTTTETDLQTVLHAEPKLVLQFWNPPHTALLLLPLAFLPFGAAYLLMLIANLTCLVGACVLLAPRPGRAWHWLLWVLVVPMFLPVQLGVIMGQLSCVLLFGFAVFVRLWTRGGALRSAMALLAWTTKPQLVPVLLLSLGCARRWRTLVLVCALPVLLTLPVVLVGGPSVVLDYIDLGHGASSAILTGEGLHLDSGHSLLGLTQWLFGPGWPSSGLTAFGTLGVFVLLGSMWRGGLHTDARRHLQLALLPLAAVLCSPHVLAYDAATWLASAWLLLTFAREVPSARRGVLVLLLVGWWGGNLAAFPNVNAVAPWGAFTAIFGLAGMGWLYRRAAPRAAITAIDRRERAYPRVA
ncbi:MAG TPA: glycosyltransferase family 87 protein [Chloroflexota bacterium]|nr:glycosyltransferase family 87 protein [Chloroflexota bacterium]